MTASQPPQALMLYSVINGSANSSAFGQNLKEMCHFGGIGGTIAFEKEWLGDVRADGLCRIGSDLCGAYVASLQHALAAKHLEALVVTVGGPAAGINLAKPSLPSADSYRSAVDISRFRDGRIDQAASRRVNGLCVVIENPWKISRSWISMSLKIPPDAFT